MFMPLTRQAINWMSHSCIRSGIESYLPCFTHHALQYSLHIPWRWLAIRCHRDIYSCPQPLTMERWTLACLGHLVQKYQLQDLLPFACSIMSVLSIHNKDAHVSRLWQFYRYYKGALRFGRNTGWYSITSFSSKIIICSIHFSLSMENVIFITIDCFSLK